MKLDPILYNISKNLSRNRQTINIRIKTIKLLEENIKAVFLTSDSVTDS